MVLLGNLLVAQAWAADLSPNGIIKQALLGAGSGALSAELSGGKAGMGALIGAGTNVIGGALLGALFDSPSYSYAPQPARTTYSQPVYTQPTYVYQQPQEVIYAPQPTSYSYASAPQTDYNRTIIRQGLLGAGVGAISAGSSGGKAGTGALIGAGTNIIGGALLDTLLAPSQQQSPVYYPSSRVVQPAYGISGNKKIVRHFDASGKLVSEEEYYV